MPRQPLTPVASANHSTDESRGPEAIYAEVYPALLRLAMFLVGDRPSAQDLCQDTFVSCMGRLKAVENPTAYLRAAVINGSRHHCQRQFVPSVEHVEHGATHGCGAYLPP